MARFFIERPVFAWVIAIIIMLAGVLSIRGLPIELYPKVAPPTVSIMAMYPGASAETIENSVTQVIEQKLVGIDNLRYFSSQSMDGMSTITLTFEPNADPDIAQVQTQNKVQGAVPQLPSEVQALGLTVAKATRNFMMVVGLYSEDENIGQQEIGDMIVTTFQDQLSRVNGVGSVQVFGFQNAMRIWLNPEKLLSYNLTPLDVQNAVRIQNTDLSAGQIGALPAVQGQQLNAVINAQSRLQTTEEFERIILRVNSDGSQVRLRDVARVELGSEEYGMVARYKRRPASGMAVSLASGANALDTAERVKARVEELAEFLPEGVKVIYPFDTTPFIELSIQSVVMTLFEAVGLVFLVMFLFLQNIRATMIPTIAVPIVLLGTFAILSMFGYSINTLTMFAMVLAIGLLVDDAIVVVENVERIMSEEDLSPKEATKKSMDQITSALIGIAVVLSAVFVPMAFFGGSAGVIYKQFSITIVSAMALSVVVAIVLSPSLCATFLKQEKHGERRSTSGFFGAFNTHFNRIRTFYQESTSYMVRRTARFTSIYVILISGMLYIFSTLPTSFLPNEDQGMMMMMVNAPSGATAERTLESVYQIEDFFLDQQAHNVDHLFTVVGFSFAGAAQNAGMGFIGLKDWDERTREDQSVFSIFGQAMGAFSQIKDAFAFAFYPPPIQELGNASGFDFQIVDRAGQGHDALMQARNQLLGAAAQNPLLFGVRPLGLDDVPQLKIDIDSEKASALGISLNDINRTLQIAWGSSYANDFVDQGRIKKVYLQGDAEFRMMPEDVYDWYVRNDMGEMVPFNNFSTVEWEFGPSKLERFNGTSSLNIQGSPAPGISTGVAMVEIEKIVDTLPDGFGIEWSGMSYEERLTGSQAPLLYGISVLVVFLCLAALYESWAVPFAVLLVVPLGVLGAVIGSKVFGMANDVYFQVALLTTVGLASKNAILIVGFAKEMYEDGMSILEATALAARQRFRPIIMTSMAFMLGVTPLALATGAGSGSQNAIGVAVMGGMFAATFLAIFFVPMFYIFVQRLFRSKFES
ncbi:efflux RND transporter permease subunit [Pseudemcibacter aquimaris]|uniref:efflux RND transporter permease subunit n=1 Tax=Pseudemcibacter aquimaris TaxID=2857064 RepID=UPI002012DFB8|nr:efflux RND transporter permease subunit [Pseudemcibacter aquimaris]MCC3861235.1 efflux RND transporter permease subunit [Pseudemcibacter aquimaris]WDU58010.1 efflux RND transporter permease subunit [Pseudemcibacter aquimaris]